MRHRMWSGTDDAEVLIVGLHKDVAAAQVDLVGAQVAADDQEAIGEAQRSRILVRRGSSRSRTVRRVFAVA